MNIISLIKQKSCIYLVLQQTRMAFKQLKIVYSYQRVEVLRYNKC